jgi:hypothetical protein
MSSFALRLSSPSLLPDLGIYRPEPPTGGAMPYRWMDAPRSRQAIANRELRSILRQFSETIHVILTVSLDDEGSERTKHERHHESQEGRGLRPQTRHVPGRSCVLAGRLRYAAVNLQLQTYLPSTHSGSFSAGTGTDFTIRGVGQGQSSVEDNRSYQ